ncbi:MAG: hypothetical protein A2V87_10560 [Deltaproteobacteria bacterium RBG_16_58_17]|nr:MAG: hypothetical protein A2V87_10560 [Deltaproteobacteria bacterium RBG_16_58_17]OHE16291.1 MAG: hypothetical protein A2X96_03360 [Syntrophobacterales bacterium GWC2_56_13]OHE20587.1 MAG: hypothetical protein A2X95_09930 [Syntrophobacterales bacterium GWF2_56_9]
MSKQSIAIIKIGFAVFFVGLFSANLIATPCWGSDNVSANPMITMDVKNEPLRSVLGKISKTTRWKIKVPDKWMDKPVTQTLNKVTLEEGLRFILKDAGVENLLLIYDENIKLITVFDTESAQRQSADRPSAQVNAQPPVVSATDEPDPTLKRPVRDAGSGPSRVNRRAKRQASSEEE